MGYWDKKESTNEKIGVRRSGYWKDELPKSPKDGSKIDYDALDNLEADMNQKADDTLERVEGIAESIKRQKAQAKDLLSAGYWISICFNNDLQKQQFLKALGYDPMWTFIQGDDFAKRVGVQYKEPDHDYSYERNRTFEKYASRAREIKK